MNASQRVGAFWDEFFKTLSETFPITPSPRLKTVFLGELSKLSLDTHEDFCQLVFLEVLDEQASGAEITEECLIRVIRRVKQRLYRAATKQPAHLKSQSQLPASQESQAKLNEALQSLETEELLFLELKIQQGLSVQEIAKAFGVSPATGYRVWNSIQKTLRQHL